MTLDAKFAQVGLGLVDGLVVAVAERRDVPRVLTTDRAHLSAVRFGVHYREGADARAVRHGLHGVTASGETRRTTE